METSAMQTARKPPRYDAIAKYYDRVMRPLERWILARLRVKVFAALPPNACLLEIGAGTGVNFSLYSPGTRGTASELSYAMLELARGKEINRNIRLVQSCAEQLPFASASFDAAVATLVFCSVTSPQEVFTELRRVVRPGGTIALLEHVRPNGLLGYVFDALGILTVALFDDHINRRTADEAKRAGLNVVTLEQHAFGTINVIVCRV